MDSLLLADLRGAAHVSKNDPALLAEAHHKEVGGEESVIIVPVHAWVLRPAGLGRRKPSNVPASVPQHFQGVRQPLMGKEQVCPIDGPQQKEQKHRDSCHSRCHKPPLQASGHASASRVYPRPRLAAMRTLA